MDVGMMMLFSSYGWETGSDAKMWEEDLRLAEIAADLGFDCVWSTEHHFNDYSFIPDNLQLMTHIAARLPNVDIGTAAVILPWHNPSASPKTPPSLICSAAVDSASALAGASPDESSTPLASAWTSPAAASTKPPS